MALTSWQPPHTMRCTDLTPATLLSAAACAMRISCAAVSDALSSPSHLQRISRATVSKETLLVISGILRAKGAAAGSRGEERGLAALRLGGVGRVARLPRLGFVTST